MSYREKLQDPRWQRKRLAVLQRDNFRCVLCKDGETTLRVHHKAYEKFKNPWEYSLDELETYCKHCHTVVEYLKVQDIYFPIIRVIKFGYDGDIGRQLISCFVEKTVENRMAVFLLSYDLKLDTVEFLTNLSPFVIKELYKDTCELKNNYVNG